MDNYLDSFREMISLRGLSDRTINCAISQLRFFTMYVLHKSWDDTQLPMRKFDEYLPYVPSKQETWMFISSIPDLKQRTMVTLMYSSGLRIGEVCRLRYEDVDRKNMRIHITHGKNRHDRYAILSKAALDLLTQYWFECDRPMGYLFPKQRGGKTDLSIPSSFQGISMPMRTGSTRNAESPVILSAMLLVPTSMRTVLICLPLKHLWDINL